MNYNDRNGGRLVIGNRPDELEWLRNWKWKYWVTLTFSRDVGREEANALLDEYLNELEAALRDSLICMISREQKKISGSGKPAGQVHFHLLIGSAVNVSASTVPIGGSCRSSEEAGPQVPAQTSESTIQAEGPSATS